MDAAKLGRAVAKICKSGDSVLHGVESPPIYSKKRCNRRADFKNLKSIRVLFTVV
jgi:hypothetical protein